MGAPVVHFEIVGRDADKTRAYYADLFGWEINADNPMSYGLVDREQNLNAQGVGIGGGIAGTFDGAPRVSVYVEVPDDEQALQRAEVLGGSRLMGPERIDESTELGMFADPEGLVVGLLKANA
jgi:predicted enzyme related to lactoylglutathione lyase